MTIRFVPARHRSPMATVALRKGNEARVWSAANDNGPFAANDGEVLAEALRHFGLHGIGSAKAAARAAHEARNLGDSEAFAHWLTLCRVFDRRLADRLAHLADLDD